MTKGILESEGGYWLRWSNKSIFISIVVSRNYQFFIMSSIPRNSSTLEKYFAIKLLVNHYLYILFKLPTNGEDVKFSFKCVYYLYFQQMNDLIILFYFFLQFFIQFEVIVLLCWTNTWPLYESVTNRWHRNKYLISFIISDFVTNWAHE